MLSFLKMASTYPFVMHAVLAFSASHLAWRTDSAMTSSIAQQHRGVALKGLQAAVADFSAENADAALAASIILSLQASDWSAPLPSSPRRRLVARLTPGLGVVGIR